MGTPAQRIVRQHNASVGGIQGRYAESAESDYCGNVSEVIYARKFPYQM